MQAEFDTDSILGSSKQRKGYGIAGRSSNPNSAEGSGRGFGKKRASAAGSGNYSRAPPINSGEDRN
jgi:hypothetical protein